MAKKPNVMFAKVKEFGTRCFARTEVMLPILRPVASPNTMTRIALVYPPAILDWPAQTLMTYHDTLGTAFVGDAQAALSTAVKAAKQV